MNETLAATLRLFNAVQVKGEKVAGVDTTKVTRLDGTKTEWSMWDTNLLERTINSGYILDPRIVPTPEMLDTIESIVGISGVKANAAFHKSWAVVRDTPMLELVLQQIAHYITTYGFEALGVYHQDRVYIPREQLDIPGYTLDDAVTAAFSLVVIKPLTALELLDKIVELASGIALFQSTIDDIMTIIKNNKYSSYFVKSIENRELRALLNDYYNLVPTDPTAFLRYVIAKLTDESLLIKNRYLIGKIKESEGKFLDVLMLDAPDNLASIFFRYKPIFLAMKSISQNKTFYNQLRKKADKMHKPIPADYLNSITSQIKHDTLDLTILENRLARATTSIYRKVRLAYALQRRASFGVEDTAIVYRVRNGRGWVSDFLWNYALRDKTRQALDVVVNSIANDLRETVSGKIFYIPSGIHYTMPASEKQMFGFIPDKSYVVVPNDMLIGVHWTNIPPKTQTQVQTQNIAEPMSNDLTENSVLFAALAQSQSRQRQRQRQRPPRTLERRVDLDLSLVTMEGRKIGWDATYRNAEKSILFSGDITDAMLPDGATELFYVKGDASRLTVSRNAMMFLNFYNYWREAECPTTVFVASRKDPDLRKNYMVDPKHIIASSLINVTEKQNVVGLITTVWGEARFYFTKLAIGNTISIRDRQRASQIRSDTVAKTTNIVDLQDVLIRAGAIVLNHREDFVAGVEYLDLSTNMLDKTTFINLMNGIYEPNARTELSSVLGEQTIEHETI